jgi:hypothetical protein
MTQEKCIFIGFSILPVKVISDEMGRSIRIDVILLRGVVEPLLESSIVVTLLKFPILLRDKSEKLSVLRVY